MQVSSPLVSIIIPTYNRAHLIGETLDSVLAQTYKNWECIVVDDGSTDYTDELLEFYTKKDSRIQYHHRPTDRKKGANACRNFGFEMSKGEYVNWFDSDDLMHPDKLKKQIDVLNNSELGYCICQSLIFEGSRKNILGLRSDRLISNHIFYDYLRMKVCWLTQAPLWKKEFLLKMNSLFDENLQAAQEWEFHCRAIQKCEDYHVVEQPLVYIRQHFDSLTYNENQGNRIWNYFLARLKVYINSDLNLEENSAEYLRNYLLNHFKEFVRYYSLTKSLGSLFLFIYPEKHLKISDKFYATLSVFSYAILNKGDVFLSKITYRR